MLYEKLDSMISESLKAGNKLELEVYRGIKTTFVNYLTAKAGNVLTNEIELNLISKMVQQRKDSIEQYTLGNRMDLANKEKEELEILSKFLPKEPTEDEIKILIKEFAETLPDKTIKMNQMKDVLLFLKQTYPTVNGGIVSKIIKTL